MWGGLCRARAGPAGSLTWRWFHLDWSICKERKNMSECSLGTAPERAAEAGRALGKGSPAVLGVSAREGDAGHWVMAAKEEPVRGGGEGKPRSEIRVSGLRRQPRVLAIHTTKRTSSSPQNPCKCWVQSRPT